MRSPGFYGSTAGFTAAQFSSIWLPANQFTGAVGSAQLSTALAGDTPGMLLDAAATEAVARSIFLPSWWTTYDVYYYWANAGAGAGDVRHLLVHGSWAVGENVSSGGTSVEVTATAGTQWVLQTTLVASGLTVSSTEMTRLRVGRDGADAADTLANDSVLWGVMLEMAT